MPQPSQIFESLKRGTPGKRLTRKLKDKRVATAILTSWGEEFRRWRESKQLIQKEAADVVGVSHDAVRSWESRRNVPNKHAMTSIRELMKSYQRAP